MALSTTSFWFSQSSIRSQMAGTMSMTVCSYL